MKYKRVDKRFKHGLRYHPLYKIWKEMKDRCYNKNNKRYKDYGKRGIIVYYLWKNNIVQFYNDNIDKWKPGLSIDRINNNGNYEPKNIQWSTAKIQANNRRNNKILTIYNESKNMKQWSEDSRCKVTYVLLKNRILIGWSPEKAISTPNKRIK